MCLCWQPPSAVSSLTVTAIMSRCHRHMCAQIRHGSKKSRSSLSWRAVRVLVLARAGASRSLEFEECHSESSMIDLWSLPLKLDTLPKTSVTALDFGGTSRIGVVSSTQSLIQQISQLWCLLLRLNRLSNTSLNFGTCFFNSIAYPTSISALELVVSSTQSLILQVSQLWSLLLQLNPLSNASLNFGTCFFNSIAYPRSFSNLVLVISAQSFT